MRKIFWLAVVFFSYNLVHAQDFGPWSPRSGGGYLNASFSYWGYDNVQLMNPDSGRKGNLLRSVTDMTFRISAVYGATDRLSISASVPLKIMSTNPVLNQDADFTDTLISGKATSLGNVNVGVKYKFYHKKWVMAASINSELKTGVYDSKTGLRTAYDSWGFVPTLHFGRSWKDRFYVALDLGGCYRTDNYSGDWRIGFETGAKFFNALWLRLNLDSRRSFRNGTYFVANNMQTSTNVNDQEWLMLNFKLEYQHPVGIGIQAGISGYFAGNNIANAPYFFGGLYYKWNYDLNESPTYRIEDRPKQ